jgi:hypothetical protein
MKLNCPVNNGDWVIKTDEEEGADEGGGQAHLQTRLARGP